MILKYSLTSLNGHFKFKLFQILKIRWTIFIHICIIAINFFTNFNPPSTNPLSLVLSPFLIFKLHSKGEISFPSIPLPPSFSPCKLYITKIHCYHCLLLQNCFPLFFFHSRVFMRTTLFGAREREIEKNLRTLSATRLLLSAKYSIQPKK